MNYDLLRLCVRKLLKDRGFTLVVVLTLAMGIGANTLVFSALNQAYFQSLPFPASEELVKIGLRGNGGELQKLSFPQFAYLRDHSQSWRRLAALQAAGLNLTGIDQPASVQATRVSAGFFEMLRVQPILGRAFDSSAHAAGADRVLLLSYYTWLGRFSGATNVIGKTVRLNLESYQVIGVLPPGFAVPVEAGNSEVWIPLVISDRDLRNGAPNVAVVARLNAHEAKLKAREELKLVDRAFREQYRVPS
jgi:hypothetical protein